jgi:hypothetical protein
MRARAVRSKEGPTRMRFTTFALACAAVFLGGAAAIAGPAFECPSRAGTGGSSRT